tara:strand:- start:5197 stop:5646 length:450 start_codon:yes stop_codon:yes gene_type:complete
MSTRLYPTIKNSFFNNPFDLLTNFDDIFLPSTSTRNSRRSISEMTPRANIVKKDGGYQIELAAPGYSRDDFEMSIDNNVLSITVNTEDGKNYESSVVAREWSYSSFTRSWTLPDATNVDSVTARYEAGILHIDVPTSGVKETRRVITVD